MNIFTLIGVILAAAIIAVLLRQYKPELAFAVSAGAGMLILLAVSGEMTELFDFANSLVENEFPENFGLLLRCAGVCLITHFVADGCRDCGERALADQAEFGGKIAMLLILLPLLEEYLHLAERIAGL
ncbi:MAG TPA: stage III sporulation AC/AD family protein [Oscillospiraceae bacterium]|nr:stage III sporulation AC/AD family protein [Oscillospiraceae bacterium]